MSLLFVISTVMAGIANAQWYEATGTAYIIDGDIERARDQAVQEAVKSAIVFAGASISSIQQVENGTLTQDTISYQSNGELVGLEVLSQTTSGDTLSVHVRAEIFAEPQCSSSGLTHTITIARFPLAHRQHAAYGGIYDIGAAVSKVMHTSIEQTSNYLKSHLWLDEVVAYEPTQLMPHPEVDALARTLARRTNSQYVLLGQVRDISVSQEESVNLAFWTYQPKPRSLAIELDLLDGMTGELVKRFRYQDRVLWGFPPDQTVDPFSADFWQSDYGKAWGRLLSDAQSDIETALSCAPSIANIINRQEAGVIVNMGSLDGISQGQTAKLTRMTTFMDPFGKVKTSFDTSGIELVVSAVEARQAYLTTKYPSALANVNINDVVIFNGVNQEW
ncbi:flagella assembly protein FlgT [Neiella marina]|uniref:Flagella assembly protein FlgT n=1 Tax=Neiella holothuriorum TaxID=2870530 RepID=A0ABS7EDV2_9GAMM|nr:flagellar assembly protein T N-terminal domain-containing protein [Neiella holothuriorum]MBW8190517.1 flagella assembly protein FlgT [Neiella holothuriorum]